MKVYLYEEPRRKKVVKLVPEEEPSLVERALSSAEQLGKDWLSGVNLLFGKEAPQAEGGPPGLVEEGNIDLAKGAGMWNQFTGETMIEKPFLYNEDGREVLVPAVWDGKLLPKEESVRKYHETGLHLGKFSNRKDAEKFAENIREGLRRSASLGQVLRESVTDPRASALRLENYSTDKLREEEAMKILERRKQFGEMTWAEKYLDMNLGGLEILSELGLGTAAFTISQLWAFASGVAAKLRSEKPDWEGLMHQRNQLANAIRTLGFLRGQTPKSRTGEALMPLVFKPFEILAEGVKYWSDKVSDDENTRALTRMVGEVAVFALAGKALHSVVGRAKSIPARMALRRAVRAADEGNFAELQKHAQAAMDAEPSLVNEISNEMRRIAKEKLEKNEKPIAEHYEKTSIGEARETLSEEVRAFTRGVVDELETAKAKDFMFKNMSEVENEIDSFFKRARHEGLAEWNLRVMDADSLINETRDVITDYTSRLTKKQLLKLEAIKERIKAEEDASAVARDIARIRDSMNNVDREWKSRAGVQEYKQAVEALRRVYEREFATRRVPYEKGAPEEFFTKSAEESAKVFEDAITKGEVEEIQRRRMEAIRKLTEKSGKSAEESAKVLGSVEAQLERVNALVTDVKSVEAPDETLAPAIAYEVDKLLGLRAEAEAATGMNLKSFYDRAIEDVMRNLPERLQREVELSEERIKAKTEAALEESRRAVERLRNELVSTRRTVVTQPEKGIEKTPVTKGMKLSTKVGDSTLGDVAEAIKNGDFETVTTAVSEELMRSKRLRSKLVRSITDEAIKRGATSDKIDYFEELVDRIKESRAFLREHRKEAPATEVKPAEVKKVALSEKPPKRPPSKPLTRPVLTEEDVRRLGLREAKPVPRMQYEEPRVKAPKSQPPRKARLIEEESQLTPEEYKARDEMIKRYLRSKMPRVSPEKIDEMVERMSEDVKRNRARDAIVEGFSKEVKRRLETGPVEYVTPDKMEIDMEQYDAMERAKETRGNPELSLERESLNDLEWLDDFGLTRGVFKEITDILRDEEGSLDVTQMAHSFRRMMDRLRKTKDRQRAEIIDYYVRNVFRTMSEFEKADPGVVKSMLDEMSKDIGFKNFAKWKLSEITRMPWWDSDINAVSFALNKIRQEYTEISNWYRMQLSPLKDHHISPKMVDVIINSRLKQKIVPEFNELSPKEQKLTKLVFDTMDEMIDKLRDVMKTAETPDGELLFEKVAQAEGMGVGEYVDKWIKEHSLDVYFPLIREDGNYVVVVKDPEGVVWNENFVKKSDALKRAAQLRNHFNYPEAKITCFDSRIKYKMDFPTILQSIHDLPYLESVLKGRGIPDTEIATLRDIMTGRYLEIWAKGRMAKAKGVPGFSTNIKKVLQTYGDSFPKSFVRRFRMPQVDGLIQGLPPSKTMYGYILRDYYLGKVAREGPHNLAVRTLIYTWYLGLKPSFGLLNWLQRIITVPWHSMVEFTKDGVSSKEATSMTAKIVKDAQVKELTFYTEYSGKIVKGMKFREAIDNSSILDDTEKWIVKKMVDRGALESLRAYEIMGNNKLTNILNIFGILSEKSNRLHAALTAIDIGRWKGLTGENLYDYVSRFIYNTHWLYGKENRPVIGRGLLAIPFVFKSFVFNDLYFVFRHLYRANKAAFAGALATRLALGGALGLWGIDQASNILDAVMMNIVGKNDWLMWKEEKKKWLDSKVGKPLRKVLLDGLPSLFGIRGSTTFGSGELFGIAGLPVVTGTIDDIKVVAGERGWDWVELLRRRSPSIVKHILDTLKYDGMATKTIFGKERLTKDDLLKLPLEIRLRAKAIFDSMPKEMPVYERVLHAIGFSTNSDAEFWDAVYAIRQSSTEIKKEKASYHRRIGKAAAAGDMEEVERLQEEAREDGLLLDVDAIIEQAHKYRQAGVGAEE